MPLASKAEVTLPKPKVSKNLEKKSWRAPSSVCSPSEKYLGRDHRLGDRNGNPNWQVVVAEDKITSKPHTMDSARRQKTTQSAHDLSSYARTPFGGFIQQPGGSGHGPGAIHDDLTSVASKARSTKSGTHLSAYGRTASGGFYPKGGGLGPGGPRTMDDDRSKASSSKCSSSTLGGSKAGRQSVSTQVPTPSVRSSAAPSDAGSESSQRTFGVVNCSKAKLHVNGDVERVVGYSRTTNGGYFRDRCHADKQDTKSSKQRQPLGAELTSEAGYRRTKSGGYVKTRSSHDVSQTKPTDMVMTSDMYR